MADDFKTDERGQEEVQEQDQRKKNDSKKIGPGTIILFIIAFAIPAYFLATSNFSFSNPSANLQQQTPQPILSPQSQDVEDFALSEVEGWQTYRNAEYGFELDYPKTCKIWEDQNSVLFGLEGAVPTEETGAGVEAPVNVEMIGIRFFDDRQQMFPRGSLNFDAPLLEFITQVFTPLHSPILQEGEKIEPIQVGEGNYEGVTAELYRDIGVASLVKRVYLERPDGRIFEFTSTIPTLSSVLAEYPEGAYCASFEEILSTFRFTP